MSTKPATRSVEGTENATFKPEQGIEVDPKDPAYQHQERDASQAPTPGNKQKPDDIEKKP